MAERQQVWVTWRGSKLLHKSRLRVDLLGGGLSRRQEEPQDGSTGNLSAHLAELWHCRGSSAGLSPAPGPSPHPREDPSWNFPPAFLAEDLRAFLPHLEKCSDPGVADRARSLCNPGIGFPESQAGGVRARSLLPALLSLPCLWHGLLLPFCWQNERFWRGARRGVQPFPHQDRTE